MKISIFAAALICATALAGRPSHAQEAPATPSPALRGLTQPQDDYPAISPDGERIVFQSNRSGSWQLWIMNRDGSGLRRLTHSGANDRTPDWSPDGNRILFSSDRGRRDDPPGRPFERRHIFMLDLSGGIEDAEQRISRLRESPTQDLHPKWTRDGGAIVFNRVSATGERGGAQIMMMDRSGADARTIDLPHGINTYASLTPDGARLVYRGTAMEEQQGGPVQNSDIYSAAADGSDRRRLTSEPSFEGWPALSPDGRTIAFSGRTDQGFHIFLMPTDGGTRRQLTFGAYNHTQPAWAPDGRSLAAYRWLADPAGEIGHLVWLDIPPE